MPKEASRTEFTVEGYSAFPLDMLMYDACYPSDSDSVDNLRDDEDHKRKKKVHLIQPVKKGYRPQITIARWMLFGWNVVEIEETF